MRYRERKGQNQGHKHTNRRKEKQCKEYLALKRALNLTNDFLITFLIMGV
jgi:hypothetical protein